MRRAARSAACLSAAARPRTPSGPSRSLVPRWRRHCLLGGTAEARGLAAAAAAASAVLLAGPSHAGPYRCQTEADGDDNLEADRRRLESAWTTEADGDDDLEADRRRLRQAVRQGDVASTFRLLRQVLGDIEAPLTPIGETPLAVACHAGVLPLVKALLDAGANPSATDSSGASCLLIASQAGHAHVARRLLEEPQVDVNRCDMYGLAPIHKAVAFGHVEVVRLLLECGADPNLKTGAVRAPEEYGARASRHETACYSNSVVQYGIVQYSIVQYSIV